MLKPTQPLTSFPSIVAGDVLNYGVWKIMRIFIEEPGS